jgi:hypothetical protein
MPARKTRVVNLKTAATPPPPAPVAPPPTSEKSLNERRADALAAQAVELKVWEEFQEEIKLRAKKVADASLAAWTLELQARFPEAVISERAVIFNINVSDQPENVIKLQEEIKRRNLTVRAVEITRSPVGLRVLCD